MRKVLSILALSLVLSGCGLFSNSGPSSDVAVGGVLGTAAGAGAGALIGSVIENGDVGQSALLGGGIGLVAGVAIGYVKDKYADQQAIAINSNTIENNRLEILERQREVDDLRRQYEQEAFSYPQPSDPAVKVYDGAKLGVYYR